MSYLSFVDQEKVKEKESRKTQTLKKDEDKKKKLMQAEVQVFISCFAKTSKSTSTFIKLVKSITDITPTIKRNNHEKNIQCLDKINKKTKYYKYENK